MTLNILFAANEDHFPSYKSAVEKGLSDKGIVACVGQNMSPNSVDYILYAPNSDLQDFRDYTKCKAVLSLWAGVEKIVGNETLTQPLVRMVDPGMTLGMVNWVAGHCLRYVLNIDRLIHNPSKQWDDTAPPLSSEFKVAVLGLGALGSACAKTLVSLGFNVSGWARTKKELDGVTCHFGPTGIKAAIQDANILVLLLPDTPETTNVVNSQTLAFLADDAKILNPGRGPLIDDEALLNALHTGKIGHATLDVFRNEPLPVDHPFWAHPNVTVSPHIASATRVSTAAQSLVDNILRCESGKPLLNIVDRKSGY